MLLYLHDNLQECNAAALHAHGFLYALHEQAYGAWQHLPYMQSTNQRSTANAFKPVAVPARPH